MADKKAAAKTPPGKNNKGGKRKRGKFRMILIMLVFGVAAPFLMPTLTLLLFGLLPTFVALITDTDKQKSGAAAIGAMNCAGLAPFLIDLWIKGQTMENAFGILRDTSNWLVILGASAVGQLIVFAVPQLMTSLLLVASEVRLKNLKQNLEQLKTSWGPDVATTKPLDKMGR
jgi:hypothetical protein